MASRARPRLLQFKRSFSSTTARREIKDVSEVPDRIHPKYKETRKNDLLCLQWPSPPRNILLTKKNRTPHITAALIEYAKHIHGVYPNINILLEPNAAKEVESELPFPVYTTLDPSSAPAKVFPSKVDFASTLGGDGTILHASSLFANTSNVPPVLSFGMGTLGFLGEWKFQEYKRAFREVYMSGASDAYAQSQSGVTVPKAGTGTTAVPLVHHTDPLPPPNPDWSSVRGKSMGSSRIARVLLRNRLKVGVFGPDGNRIGGTHDTSATTTTRKHTISTDTDVYAMNEVIVHRGASPHLAIIDVYIGGRHLTEAVADGMIISTPTGSTAYSLSSGGSIVHPLVPSLLLTPICPRSLSFRPLVLPSSTPITLRLSERNRGKEVEVSIDGVRVSKGVGVGMEVRVVLEEVRDPCVKGESEWKGGVPSIVRGTVGMEELEEDHWVGGLNGLLKFNYPFGEE